MIDLLLQVILILAVILFFPLVIYINRCVLFYRYQRYIIYRPRFEIKIQSWEKTLEHTELFYRTKDGILISAWYVPFISENTVDKESTTKDSLAVATENKQDNDKEVNTKELEEDTSLSSELQKSIPIPAEKPKGTILFCHGNAGNISQRIDSFKIFQELGYNIFIFDYRGYGKSIGATNEKGTYLDAEGAWLYLVEKMKVKPEEIIIFGRSLGGAIATYLAHQFQPRALILESTFTSALDMADTMFRWLPVKLLTRYKYNTAERLKDIHCPVLIVHSPDDRVVPYIHGQHLYEIANPPKYFLRIKGSHLDGFLKSRYNYVEGLRNFLNELSNPLPKESLELELDQ